MKKLHLLPNLFTAFSLTCGLFVIFKMSITTPGAVDEQLLIATAGFLILASFADLLDGALARAMKATSDFGGLFDSLTDAITFGVCPSVIILKTFSLEPGTELSFWLTSAVMVFSVCSVLRLVRFTVAGDPLQPGVRHHFIGLPTPAAAAAAISANLFFASDALQQTFPITPTVRVWLLFTITIALAYLMVSRLRFPSLKNLRIQIATFQQVVAIVLSAVLLFYGLLHHFPMVFFTSSWLYILTALILSAKRRLFNKEAPLEPEEAWEAEG